MRKRFLCILLATVLLLSLVAAVPMPVRAQSNLKTSDALVELLKKFEGFTKVCVKDGVQRSVGYGTRCDVCNDRDPNYPNNPCTAYTEATPITEAHATLLMKNFLVYFENKLNAFADKHGITFTQNEFDALISFTYNCGEGWMLEGYDPEGNFRNAIINRATGDKLVYAFGLWSKSGNTVSVGHVRRRMIEADVYLNGKYASSNAVWPENLRYVYLDGNGGTTRYYYQTFHAAEICPIRAEFTSIPKDGQGNNLTLEGWYTKPEGGVKVENLSDALQNGHVLYAHWVDGTGQTVTVNTDNSQAVDVNVLMPVAPKWWPNTLYEGPGTYYSEVRKTVQNEQLHLTKIVTGKDGAQWGYCSDGWMPLSHTNYSSVVSVTGTWYQVTATDLRFRKEPTIDSAQVGMKQPGDQILITQTQVEDGTGRTWGKMADGNWICIISGNTPYAIVMDPQPESKPVEVPGVTIKSISLGSAPTRKEYALNGLDLLPDLTGGTIVIHYSNGDNQTRNVTRHMVSGFDNTKEGKNTITVTVGGKTVTFDVNIVYKVLENISITSAPTKTTYLIGEDLDKSGLQVMANYSNDTSTPVTGYTVTGYNKNKIGTQTITVTYMGKTATFNVTVKGKTATGLTITSKPTKLEYIQGNEALNLSGGFVKISYAEGGDETTSITKDMISGFDNMVLGKQTVTVTYGGFSDTFEVTIIKPTITFLNYDGSVVAKLQYALGEEVKAPEAPTKPDDEVGSYEFDGWDREVVPCTGNATYTATFKLSYAMGDLDRDRTVDEGDAIYLLRHVLFPQKYPIYAWADYDANGSVSEGDAIYLLRHVLFPQKYPLKTN